MSHTAERRDSNNYLPFVLIGFFLVACVGFFAIWPMLWSYSWRDRTQRGILDNSSDWPEPIQELATAIASKSSNSKPIEVYLLYGQRASILSTVVCRMPFSDETWDTIESRLELRPVGPTFWAGLREQIVSKSSLSWWPPTDHNVDYFASARLLDGDESDLYVCAIDRVSEIIHIHYHFNF